MASPTADIPATQRLYLVLGQNPPLVIRGWTLAEAIALERGVNAKRVASLEQAHDILIGLNGFVPDSAQEICTVHPAAAEMIVASKPQGAVLTVPLADLDDTQRAVLRAVGLLP